MSDINTSKVDGNTVSASEFNQLAEIDNLISTSGQTPSTTNLEQISIGSARYSSAGQFYTDGGTANAYVLSPVSPFKSPVSATAGEGYFNGMVIRFLAGNANSGASTVNVNNAGSKSLVKSNGSALTAGDIPANIEVMFVYDGTKFVQVLGRVPATTTTQGVAFLSNPITISINGLDLNNDINFSAGVFQFNDGSGQAVATATMTKRLDATWSAGTNQGGLLNGTAVPKANDSTYHCYVIYDPTNNITDFAFLLGVSGTAPDPTSVLPSGYTKFAFRGSVITDGSGNIIPFNQFGRSFAIAPRIQFTNTSQSLNTETLRTLQVPKGINVRAFGNITLRVGGTGGANAMIYDADTSITITTHLTNLWAAANTTEGSCSYQCWTNKSGQLKTNATINAGSPTCTLSIALTGWEFDNKTLNF